MCQKAVEIIIELVILFLSCFGHTKNVWFYADSYQGGLWLFCYDNSTIMSTKTGESLVCSDYDESAARNFSHSYAETLVSKGGNCFFSPKILFVIFDFYTTINSAFFFPINDLALPLLSIHTRIIIDHTRHFIFLYDPCIATRKPFMFLHDYREIINVSN